VIIRSAPSLTDYAAKNPTDAATGEVELSNAVVFVVFDSLDQL